MFKLIAIQTLEKPKFPRSKVKINSDGHFEGNPEPFICNNRRYENIMKILHPCEIYYLCDNYTLQGSNMVKKETTIPLSFNDQDGVHISVSAIVGKNGSGKSSLIELMLRLLNNMHFTLLLKEDKTDLIFIEDIHARLYYEVATTLSDNGEAEKIFIIEQNGDMLKAFFQGEKQEILSYSKGSSPVVDKNAYKCLAFFTAFINYSAYSYNYNDFITDLPADSFPDCKSNDFWINHLFHKADSYQSGLVLIPERIDGQADYAGDVKRQRERLIELILDVNDPLPNLLGGKKAYGMSLDTVMDLYYVKKSLKSKKLLDCLGAKGLLEIDDCIHKVVKAWNELFGFDVEQLVLTNKADRVDRDRALRYIIYKSIVTLNSNQNQKDPDGKILYLNTDDNYISDGIGAIFRSHSSKNKKIRRCFNYLLFADKSIKGPRVLTVAYREWMKNVLDGSVQSKCTLPLNDKKVSQWVIERDELLPPPSFRCEPIVSTVEQNVFNIDDETIPLSSFSSGEKQLIANLSTIIYHLRNIDSIDGNSNIKYKNVQLIFDEIELFFHPEYQRVLIGTLLSYIQGMKLKSINNISILLSTHSPFVLSDIPSGNILCIERGLPNYLIRKNRTFAANIYDLLNNNFFLNEFIGEFAMNKIDSLVQRIDNTGLEIFDEAHLKKLYDEIGLIGDDVIRIKLKEKLDAQTGNKMSVIERIKYLENELNALKAYVAD